MLTGHPEVSGPVLRFTLSFEGGGPLRASSSFVGYPASQVPSARWRLALCRRVRPCRAFFFAVPKWESALVRPSRVKTQRVRKGLKGKELRFALVQKREGREQKSAA